MSSTLQEAVQALKTIKVKPCIPRKKKVADELLGKFKGIIPGGKTSTQFIKELRASLYGKIK
ncbi:hypothetical protein KAU86_01625 [bacterium]|nr:hypothetical protein [bacterium]MCK4436627.1 hypothetical protein [bacterium]